MKSIFPAPFWNPAALLKWTSCIRKEWGLYELTAADGDGNLFRVFYDVAAPERERA